MPAYNEAATLEDAVRDLLQTISPHVGDLEIIIVDDGSYDATAEIAARLQKKHSQIKVITHKINHGIGACYRDALRIAAGDYFAWFPADHEDPAEEFLPCLDLLASDTIVTCHHRGFDRRSRLRRGMSIFYTGLLNKIFKINLQYYNGMTIFPIKIVKSLPLVSDGFLMFSENLVRAIKQNHRVIEVAFPLKGRKAGKSKIYSFSSLWQMSKDAARILLQAKLDNSSGYKM